MPRHKISWCVSLVHIKLSFTGLSEQILAARPIHLVFLLSIPNLFAMGSMAALYIAITSYAWTSDNGIATTLTKIGTTMGAVVIVALFTYSVWLMRDMGKHKRQEETAVGYGESKISQ
jgi:hypothetical protein